MARKRSGKPTRTRWLRPAVRAGLTVAVVAGLLAALAWVGDRAGTSVLDRPRYAIRFRDVECDAPPGVGRDVFLSEVRYLGKLPESFQRLDPQMADAVRTAFAAHPWVERVGACGPTADGGFRVELAFRVPVLRVRVAGGTPAVRTVDAAGVLLPAADAPGGLPELANEVPAPRTPAGQPWDDPVVKRAAELVREFDAVRVERTAKGWRVTQRSGRVLSVSW